MYFNKVVSVFIMCFLFVACSDKTIPSHKDRVAEESSSVVQEEVELKEFTQFNESHKKVDSLISSNDIEKRKEALSQVSKELFSPQSTDPVIYTSSSYVGYINLYVKIFVFWKNNKSDQSFNTDVEESLKRFKEKFIDSCVSGAKNCDLLKNSLKQDSSTVTIVTYFIEQEADLKKRLELVGVAYDVAGRRKESRLNDLYIETFLDVVEKNNSNNLIEDEEVRRHTINMVALFSGMDWTSAGTQSINLFKRVSPWKYNTPVKTAQDTLRAELVKYMPLYAKADADVKKELQKKVTEWLDSIKKNKADLSTYPAYSTIRFDQLYSEDPLVVYLLLSTYYQKVDLKEAGLYLSSLDNKGRSLEKLYKLSKDLVRWDIAQLSIDSTKQLAEAFLKEDIKTKDFVQDNLDDAKKLVPQWTEFHSVRLGSISKFMSANTKDLVETDEQDIRDFYASINRNIQKSVVYPNMLAFMYYMAKTEWKAQIRIWFWTIDLDTTDVFDYLFTGNYSQPWFNFMNLTQQSGYGKGTKKSLFRSEVLDSFYYLISTKTAQEYKIDVSDFIKTSFETILKKRAPKYQSVLDVQKRAYLSGDSSANQFINWCNNSKKGIKTKEQIHFYNLYEFLTPYSTSLKDVDGLFGAGDSYNARMSLYFHDLYNTEEFLGSISVPETTDRLRSEYMPIMHVADQLIQISERLNKENPSQININLEEAKKYYSKMEELQQKYLGTQITIAEMMGDCSHYTYNEAHKRARELARNEYAYLKNVVHPLLVKTTKGEMSVEEANNIIKRANNNHPAFQDNIIVMNEKVANYKMYRQSFMLRVRQFLINGMKISNPNITDLDIQPVVGANMEIPIPPAVFEDEKNPYFNTNGNLRPMRDVKYDSTMTADEFAGSSISLTTDELAGVFWSYKFTKWDKTEAKDYSAINELRIQFLIERLLMNGVKYIDYSLEACRNPDIELPKECYKTNEISLDDIGEEVAKIFKAIELDDEVLEYMEMIGYKGYIASQNMSMQLKFDGQGNYDFNTNSLPYTEAAGFFDSVATHLKHDFLGLLYNSEYDVFLASQSSDGGEVTCMGLRDGCYWENEKIRAEDFFTSRTKRPGIIFNFDRKILEDNYNYIKEDALKKHKWLAELEEKGQALLEKHRDGQLDYLFDRFKPATRLKPLSQINRNNNVDYEKFFMESTEGFYVKEPNWNEYLDTN